MPSGDSAHGQNMRKIAQRGLTMKPKFCYQPDVLERSQKRAAKTLSRSNRDRALAARYGFYVPKRKKAEAGK